MTVEPGVYLTGLGGVRIEDLVIVGEDGPEILTKLHEGAGHGQMRVTVETAPSGAAARSARSRGNSSPAWTT